MSKTLLTGCRIFDGTGSDLRNQDLLIEGETLRLVSPGAETGADETVDLTGATVLPGFIDSHVHVCLSTLDLIANLGYPFSYQFFLAERNLRRTLDVGITTVRDASRRRPGDPARGGRRPDRRPGLAHLDHRAEPDRRPRGPLAAERQRARGAQGAPWPARPASSTARTRPASASAS